MGMRGGGNLMVGDLMMVEITGTLTGDKTGLGGRTTLRARTWLTILQQGKREKRNGLTRQPPLCKESMYGHGFVTMPV